MPGNSVLIQHNMWIKRRFYSVIIFSEVIYNKIICGLRKNTGSKNSILIIKVDAIGDYILFRNCLSVVKNSLPYKNCKITLLGNSLWKDIAMVLDTDTVDDFLWVDYNSYKTFSYKRTFLSDISKRKFSEVIMFHYSRTVFTEVLAFAANAPVKTGMYGDFSHLSYKIRSFTDRLYSRLIRIGEAYTHEFRKNLRFAELLCINTAAVLPLEKLPEINIAAVPQLHEDNRSIEKYILISSGAGDFKRMYPYNKLLIIAERLFNEGFHLCFTGTAQDTDFVNMVKKHNPAFEYKITDFTGKTNLVQLLQIINRALVVICNETSVYHISIALKKPVICFAGGGHFSRFANYGNIERVKLIYKQMTCFNCNWNCIYTVANGDSFPCIQSIPNPDILEMVKEMTA